MITSWTQKTSWSPITLENVCRTTSHVSFLPFSLAGICLRRLLASAIFCFKLIILLLSRNRRRTIVSSKSDEQKSSKTGDEPREIATVTDDRFHFRRRCQNNTGQIRMSNTTTDRQKMPIKHVTFQYWCRRSIRRVIDIEWRQ